MIWELPFWLSLLVNSLLPGTKTPWVEVASIPISSRHILIFVAASFYFLSSNRNDPITNSHKPWHSHLPYLTAILLFYAAISMMWSEMENRDILAMSYTLAITFATCLQGYSMIAKRPAEFVRPLLWRVTIYLAVLGLLYSAESFFSLGLRSEITKVLTDFGVQRVRGPLFSSATGHFILLPALAFTIQETIQDHRQRRFKLAVIFSLMFTMMGLGSRAGLVVLGIFFVFLFLFMGNGKQRFLSLALMMIVVAIAGALVFSQANTDRLTSIEDEARNETHLTSLEIIKNRSDIQNIFGSGYGSYWHWYIPSAEFESNLDPNPPLESDNPLYNYVITPFGYLLPHSHSTFLLLVVELGMVGLLYLLIFFNILFQFLLGNFRDGSYPIFICGIAASSFSMFFDLFIFKSPEINILWWLFLWGASSLRYNRHDLNGYSKNNQK